MPSILSNPLRDGEFLLWHVQPSRGEAGLEVHQAQIDEVDGLKTFEAYLISRRKWRDVERSLGAQSGLALARVPSAWARWLLEEGYQRALSAGRVPPREFAERRHLIEPAGEGGFTVTVPALPGLMTEGDTFEDAHAMVEEAIRGYLEVLAKDGEEIPVEPGELITRRIAVEL